MEEIVKKYFTPEEPASFTIASAFKRQHSEVHDEKELARMLSAYPSYTLHKPSRRRFKRSRTIVSEINDQIQIDLSDMSEFSRHNDGKNGFYAGSTFFRRKHMPYPFQQNNLPQ